MAPLVAAVVAPLSTLLDIPAVTENWFSKDGSPLPDPKANLILSIVGLVFNFLANALLITRFSIGNRWWRKASSISVICWFVKFIIALVNVLVYGLMARKVPGNTYDEGFWCAVISLLTCTLVLLLLAFHYMLAFGQTSDFPTAKQLQVRIAGRHFMLQNTFFVALVGTLALFMSRLEHWTYVQGIYFSIVTFLTIGFGDFFPTKPVTQIVLFPFMLMGIAQLANIVGMIISFFASRIEARSTKRRARLERKKQELENDSCDKPDLRTEVQFLSELHRSQAWSDDIRDLITNLSGFLTFWVFGALIFSQIESWTYGRGLYFCYVFFFSVGYGDFAPITPAGRVVFIVYALLAVPVMASFAVQTVTQIFRKISDRRLQMRKVDLGLSTGIATENVRDQEAELDRIQSHLSRTEDGSEEEGIPVEDRRRLADIQTQKLLVSHENIIAQSHDRIDQKLDSGKKAEADLEAAEREEDKMLTEHLLGLAVELERRARRLLIAHMEDGSSGQILLRADRNVQLRDVKALAFAEKSDGNEHHQDKIIELMKKCNEEEAELSFFPYEMDEKQTLQEIRKYRESFAGILAAGTRLMKLKGDEQYLFERRKGIQKNVDGR